MRRKRGETIARATLWLASAYVGWGAMAPRVSLAQGCAMCATAIGNDAPLARAMNISVLFLMSMPFLLTAAVGGWLWYSFWRSQRSRPPLRVLRADREETS